MIAGAMADPDARVATEDRLRSAIARQGDAVTVTLDPAFQGLPDAAHGGSVLALLDALAGTAGARRVRGTYLRRVPLGVALTLAETRAGSLARYRLHDPAGVLLVEGDVAPAAAPGPAAWPEATAGAPLPVSATCLACGVDNPLGLRAAPAFDDDAVWCRWPPRPGFRTADGRLAVVALATLLDEAAFWLGALASGESGMTTSLRLTLAPAPAFGGEVVVGGARRAVRPHPDDPRYWQTSVAARDARGAVLATADITFVAVRGAARRLVQGLLARNPAEVIRRVFPAHVR
jgi:hypothetical protein